METHVNNLNPYKFFGEFTIPHHAHGEPPPERESSKDLGTREYQIGEVLDEMGLKVVEDEGDQQALGAIAFVFLVHV